MKNKLFKFGCIAGLVLILASCVDCKQCREQCAECRSDTTAPAPAGEGTINYMMTYKSVKEMVMVAPAECTDFWIVDIPSADGAGTASEEFVLIPINANRQPVPGNWMKGTRRCPPVCDIGGLRQAAAEGTLTSLLVLSPLNDDAQRSITDRIRQAPRDRNNGLTVSRSALAGLSAKSDGTLVITCPSDGGTNLAVVLNYSLSRNGRTHIDL